MLVLRNLVVVSASAIIALGYSTSSFAAPKASANKQNSSKIDRDKTKSRSLILQENYLDRSLNYRNGIVKIAQMTSEEPEQPEEPAPEPVPTIEGDANIPPDVRPSPNPLLFPTEPEEVKIDTVRAITLQQAIELALQNNKELQVVRQNLEAARATLREAEAGLYPTLTGQLEYNHSFNNQGGNNSLTEALLNESINLINNQLIDPLNQQQNNINLQPLEQVNLATDQPSITDNFTGTMQIDYGIYSGGEVKAEIRRAEKQIRQQQLQVEIQGQQVRFEATRDYYNLQNADAAVEISRATVRDATQSLRDAQLLEEAGLGTRFSVLTAEVDLAQVQQNLTNAIADQQISRRQLATTLGVGQKIELRSAEPIEEAGDWNLSLEESIVLAYKNRAELEQQLLEKEISKEDETIFLAAIRPRVNFFFNYNVSDELNDSAAITDNYAVGTRLTWNIFDGGAALARADRAKIQGQIAETNFANTRHGIRLNIEQAFYNLEAQKENIATTSVNVDRAEENLRLARLRFQAGVGTQTEVIDAQRDLADARGNRLQAINAYNQSLNQLQREISNLPDSQLFEVR